MRILLSIIILIFITPPAFAFKLIQDEEVESVLYQIARPIYKVAGLSPDSLEIFIVEDNELNAFAADGQKVFLTTGLLSFSSDPEAVAGVISHEVGHIAGGHLAARKEEMANLQKKAVAGMMLGLLAGVAAGSTDVGVAGLTAAHHSGEMGFYSFSRTQESSADSAGVKYMKKLGINNSGLLSFLKNLSSNENTFYSDISPYLRTHPLSQQRMDFIKNFFTNVKSSDEGLLNHAIREKFKRAYTKVKAYSQKPDVTLRDYESDQSLYGNYARAIAYLKLADKPKALHFTDLLLQQEPHNPYFNELKAQVLFEGGQVQQAIQYFDIALKNSKQSNFYKLALAQSLIISKTDITRSIVLIKQVISVDRNNYFAWHLLGSAYQAQGNKTLSTLAFAWRAILLEDEETAHKMVKTVEKSSSAKDANIQAQIKELKSALEE